VKIKLWRPHQDSNLEHALRRRGIYPVNRWGRFIQSRF